MNTEANAHYSEDYFKWQSKVGSFGGTANKKKFQQFIAPTDFVIDFGAGGGFLIENIDCGKKLGVEINPTARASAEKRGVQMIDSLKSIQDNSVDKVISNHALEHCDSPLDILKEVLRVLKPGGKAIFVVPCESISRSFDPKDIHLHLFTWSPNCLGNLFLRAGFEVVESKPYFHKWPQRYFLIQKLFGWTIFHKICGLYQHFSRDFFQTRCIAIKK